jgi:hypothetical protein
MYQNAAIPFLNTAGKTDRSKLSDVLGVGALGDKADQHFAPVCGFAGSSEGVNPMFKNLSDGHDRGIRQGA